MPAIRPRYWLSIGCMVLMVLAIGGHVYYWYWPRLRVAVPCSDIFAGLMPMSETADSVSLWIPYPHQNLGALARTAEGGPALFEAVGRLLKLPNLRLPAFGPFIIPPASELRFEVSADGSEVRVAAHIYPSIGWLARAAGWLAGNPWLAGGEAVVGGHSVRIAWVDGVWSASTMSADHGFTLAISGLDDVRPDPKIGPESLALLRLGEGFDPFPAGVYRLERSGEEFRVAMGETDAASTSRWFERLENLERPVVVMANESDRQSRQQNVLILTGDSSRVVPEFPAAVVLHRGDGLGWKLPGEGFLSFLGMNRFVLDQGLWLAKSIDRPTAKSGIALVPQIVGLQTGAVGNRLRFGAWIDVEFAADLAEDLTRATNGFPKVVRADLQTWIDLSTVLSGFGEVESLSLQVLHAPDAVDLRLHLSHQGSL